jgi:hypothetical protein
MRSAFERIIRAIEVRSLTLLSDTRSRQSSLSRNRAGRFAGVRPSSAPSSASNFVFARALAGGSRLMLPPAVDLLWASLVSL